MSPRNSQLDGLRRQIDSLDDRIHDLLIERSSMIEQIIAAKRNGTAKLRPGREAEIARRLVGRHRGRFPAASVVRIWREIINAFTCMQGPFSNALPAPAADREVWDLARDHFGGTPERVSAEHSADALRAVIAGEVTLAVLPWGGRAGSWLRHMLDAGTPELRICFGLPFVRSGPHVETAAVAVGLVDSEPTGSDRSVFAIDGPAAGDRAAIEAAAEDAGLEDPDCRVVECPDGVIWVLEIGGRTDAKTVGRLEESLSRSGARVSLIGTHADPIIVSSEEQTDP